MGSRSYSRLVRPYILALTISTDCVLLMERRARAFSSSISPPLTQRFGLMPSVSALPPKADMVQHDCDVRFVPCVDGSELARRIFTSQSWSVQPCVRPLSAVHMTAGHNALRGSGPGQKDAFNDALARVGCPDRRIDRLCFTCCSPSQPSHHAKIRGAISLDLQRRRIIVPRARSHHCPSHSRKLVGKRDRRNFGRPSRQ